MFLFSTIIYFGESPIGYDVHREEEIFRFVPAINSKSDLQPPLIRATYSTQIWFIEGTQDKEIIEQVNKVIELNELISVLRAAS